MNTKFADRIFRVLFVLAFIVGMIMMPNIRAIAQSPRLSSMVNYLTADGDTFTARVSVDSAGVEGDHDSYKPSISADGRYVAFYSRASNLVTGDTNSSGPYNAFDVFVHDNVTGATTRVSVDSAGMQGNSNSTEPSISADGRYVAFRSESDNLVSGDTNGADDVFVHDRLLGSITRVSFDPAGNEIINHSGSPSISADGHYVAFDSGGRVGFSQIFLRDTVQNTTACVTCGSWDNPSIAGEDPSISADGRYVAFWSEAAGLVPGDTNQKRDVFVHEIFSGTTTLVSVDSVGTQGNDGSSAPSISADGRYVAFGSYASNLVAGDTNETSDIFVRDTVSNTTTRVSVDSAGAQADSDSWEPPSISADGRYVAFWSYATNLVAGDTNRMPDVFVRDTVSNTTTRLSLDSAGGQGNLTSGFPSISANGRYVAFESKADTLVPGDTNFRTDVFVRALEPVSSAFDPWLEVWYPEDRIQVVDWPLNTGVTLMIDNDFDTANGFLYRQDYERGTEGRIYIELTGIFDIKPGQVVSVSAIQYMRFHQVTNLRVDGWDVVADTVFGSAAPNSFVQIHASNDGGISWAWRSTTADDSGNWVFNFSEPGTEPGEKDILDVKPGTQGAATQPGILPDEGGQTHFAFKVGQTPTFLVFRDWIGLAGWDWPPGINVQVTADDPETASEPDIEFTVATNADGFFEADTVFHGLQPGWVITVIGDGITMTHTVRAISITDVDTATDIVRGTADPGTEVWVSVSGGPGVFTTADSSGEWVADFLGTHDITIGSEVGVQERDENGNGTYFGYTVPFPPIPMPSGTWLTTPGGTATSGTPTVHWEQPMTVSTTGPSGGTGTATLTMSDGHELTITWVESPPSSGTYTATFPPLSPHHGPGLISFIIHYPDGNDQQGLFTLYIDPSGVVRDTSGDPVVGATVTLYRSVNPVGPFVAVSDGSALMSPGNRKNPDLTDANGLFGWDVVLGFYKVRAEKVGCSAPEGGAFVETAVMTIPPPVTDLELILKCQEPPLASAGGPYTVEWGAMLTLDGSGSTDPDNDIASYEWDLDGDGGYDDASGMTVTTSFNHFGEQTIGLRVTDNGGLSDTDTATVTVLPWMLKGFYPPVDMNGVYNIVKKGSTVPFKFEIFAGLTELTDIAYVKSLTHAQTSCNAAATTDEIETIGTGGTSLRYDAMAGQFVYNWKMPNSAGKCYRVTMTGIDGSSLVAYFKLK